jgi:hypothetical protein
MMNGEGQYPANIRKILAGLPPQTRQPLELAIEKARAQGKADALYAVLSQQFKTEPEPFRMPEPSRLFYNPLEKFLIGERPPHKVPGRVWRGALLPVWLWIEQHVSPQDVERCRRQLQELDGKVSSYDDPALQAIETELRKAILPKLDDQLARARQTPETHRRFASHLGGDYQAQEAEDIYALLKYKDIIEACGRNLPNSLSLNSPNDVANITKLFGKLAEIDKRLPYYAGVLLQKKIDQPAHLPLWAATCAGSDDPRKVADSPFAALIDIAIGDAACMAELCINDLTKPSENNQAAVYVRNYAIICRNLHAAIDFEVRNSDWLKRLSETRLRISDVIAQELGGLFQLMRRNVRPLRAFGSQTPYPPDEFDLNRLCFLISILGTIRTNVQEFALNELVNRVHNECDGYLQLAIDSLQEELRTNFSDKRRIILSYADAAVRVGRAWHNDDYAAVLKRAFETAAATPQKTPENKASA